MDKLRGLILPQFSGLPEWCVEDIDIDSLATCILQRYAQLQTIAVAAETVVGSKRKKATTYGEGDEEARECTNSQCRDYHSKWMDTVMRAAAMRSDLEAKNALLEAKCTMLESTLKTYTHGGLMSSNAKERELSTDNDDMVIVDQPNIVTTAEDSEVVSIHQSAADKSNDERHPNNEAI